MNVHPLKQTSQQRRLHLEQQSIILDAKLEQLQQVKQDTELELHSLLQTEQSASIQIPPTPELQLLSNPLTTAITPHE